LKKDGESFPFPSHSCCSCLEQSASTRHLLTLCGSSGPILTLICSPCRIQSLSLYTASAVMFIALDSLVLLTSLLFLPCPPLPSHYPAPSLSCHEAAATGSGTALEALQRRTGQSCGHKRNFAIFKTHERHLVNSENQDSSCVLNYSPPHRCSFEQYRACDYACPY